MFVFDFHYFSSHLLRTVETRREILPGKVTSWRERLRQPQSFTLPIPFNRTESHLYYTKEVTLFGDRQKRGPLNRDQHLFLDHTSSEDPDESMMVSS